MSHLYRVRFLLCASVLGLSVPANADSEQALNNVDSLFSGYFAWFGSMYDRTSGGAYFSTPSRERPQSYPPHIESTSKYSNVLGWSEVVDRVPASMRTAMIGFIKSRQVGDSGHAYYGFFLDSNFPTLDSAHNGATVNERRAARALGFSLGILDLFGATPDYPTPDPSQNTKSLAHLQSGQAFKDWIAARPWSGSAWTVGSDIAAQTTLVDALSEPLKSEILQAAFERLPHYQNSTTGFWGAANSNPYIPINGAHKIVLFYEHYNQPVPHADALLASTLSVVQNTAPVNLLFTYNSLRLVTNLQKSLSTPMTDPQMMDFVIKQAAYLATFHQPDGGFAGLLSGTVTGNEFHPTLTAPFSDTDVGGLALKARDTLHTLIHGSADPLPYAMDARLFGMTGANSEALVKYHFVDKSLAPEATAGIRASHLSAVGTVTNGGPDNDGFQNEVGPVGGYQVAHVGFNDPDSYYEFTVTPPADGLNLYFLALWMRSGATGTSTYETVLLKYSIDGGATFKESGRSSVPPIGIGFLERDIPLLTLPDLTAVKVPLIFRIHGLNFGESGRTFGIDGIELFGVKTPAK